MAKKSKCLYDEKVDKLTGILPYNHVYFKNNEQCRHQVFIATPATGLVRMEWAQARFGQIIPCNWGYKSAVAWMSSCAPMGYLVADAQNVAVKYFMEQNSEWLFFIEQDNVLPPDCFLRMNDHIKKKTAPIVSGLYFTKSFPSEPLVYRGRGNSYFSDWKLGDKVWVDAVPMGCVIIHRSIIEYMWKNSPAYMAGSVETRRVFHTPEASWYDPQKGIDNAVGTSDMEFCARIIVDKILEKTGWTKFAKKEFPFLIDTEILVGHIDENGIQYPRREELQMWTLPEEKRPASSFDGTFSLRR